MKLEERETQEALISLVPSNIVKEYNLNSKAQTILGNIIYLMGMDKAKENGYVFRSNTDFSKDTKISIPTINKYTTLLENLGLIKRTSGSRLSGASTYILLFDFDNSKTIVKNRVKNEENFTNNFTKELSDLKEVVSLLVKKVEIFTNNFTKELSDLKEVVSLLVKNRVKNEENFTNNFTTDTDIEIDKEIDINNNIYISGDNKKNIKIDKELDVLGIDVNTSIEDNKNIIPMESQVINEDCNIIDKKNCSGLDKELDSLLSSIPTIKEAMRDLGYNNSGYIPGEKDADDITSNPTDKDDVLETDADNTTNNIPMEIDTMKTNEYTIQIPVMVSGEKHNINLQLKPDDMQGISNHRKYQLWLEYNHQIFEYLPEKYIDGYWTKDATKTYVSRDEFEKVILPNAIMLHNFKSYKTNDCAAATENVEKRSVIDEKPSGEIIYHPTRKIAQECLKIENKGIVEVAGESGKSEPSAKKGNWRENQKEYEGIFAATKNEICEYAKSHTDESYNLIRANCLHLKRMYREHRITDKQMSAVQRVLVDRMAGMVKIWKSGQSTVDSNLGFVENLINSTNGAKPDKDVINTVVSKLNKTSISSEEKIDIVGRYFNKLVHPQMEYINYLKSEAINKIAV